jgi:hypothetical protein
MSSLGFFFSLSQIIELRRIRGLFDEAVSITELISCRMKWEDNCEWYVCACWSRVSSGSIVSGYGLDYRAIGVRSPEGAKDFSSSLCVETGSGAHPASCTVGTGGPFPGGKARPGRDADHSTPSSAEVVNE